MSKTSDRPTIESNWSRRRILECLGWGGAAGAAAALGPARAWGELRLPQLEALSRSGGPGSGDRMAPAQSMAEKMRRGGIPGANPMDPPGPALLNSNENPHGLCPAAREVLPVAAEKANRYPDEFQEELTWRIAKEHGVATEQVVLGCGSTQILQMAAYAFVSRDGGLLQARPTFEALGFHVRANGFEPVGVPLDLDGRHDLTAMREAIDERTQLVYICNPANPSSTVVPWGELCFLVANLPEHVVVLVDEAYHHFVDDPGYQSCLQSVHDDRPVVIARTFSKIYGMAGLRCGYAVAPLELARKLRARRTGSNVNAIAGACAVASLDDETWVGLQRRLNADAMRTWTDELDRRGIPYWDSQTNFVMADLGRDINPIRRALRERDVWVGRLFPDLPTHLRVSVGTEAEMGRLVAAFGEVIG